MAANVPVTQIPPGAGPQTPEQGLPVANSTLSLSTQLVVWGMVGFILLELIGIVCLLRYCCRARYLKKRKYKEREIILSDHPDGAPTMYYNRGQKNEIQNMLDMSQSQTYMNAPANGLTTYERQSIASIRANLKPIDNGLETNETMMVDDITSIYSVGHLSHQQRQQPKIKKIHHANVITEMLPSAETISTSKNVATDYNERMHQELSSEDIYTLRLTSTLPMEGSGAQTSRKYESYMYDGSLNRPAFEIVSHADIKPATPIHFEQTKDLSARSFQSPNVIKWKTNASFNASMMDALDKSTNQDDDLSYKEQFSRKYTTSNLPESPGPATIHYRIQTPQGMQTSQSSNLNYGYERQVKNTGEQVDWHMAHDLRTTDWDRLKKQNGSDYNLSQRSTRDCQQQQQTQESKCPHNPPCYSRLTYQRSATQNIAPFSSVQNEVSMNETKPTATLTTSIGGMVNEQKSARTRIISQVDGDGLGPGGYQTNPSTTTVTYHTPFTETTSNNAISKSTWRHFEPNPPPAHEREQSQYKLHAHDMSRSSCMLTNSSDDNSSSSINSINTRRNPNSKPLLDEYTTVETNPSSCYCSNCSSDLDLIAEKRPLGAAKSNNHNNSSKLDEFLDHDTFINHTFHHSKSTSDHNDHHISKWTRADRRRERANPKFDIDAANDDETRVHDGARRVAKSLTRTESKKKNAKRVSESLESLAHVENTEVEHSFRKAPKKSSIGNKIDKCIKSQIKKAEKASKSADSAEDSLLDRSNISIIDVQYPNTDRKGEYFDENFDSAQIPDLPPPLQFQQSDEPAPKSGYVSVIPIEKQTTRDNAARDQSDKVHYQFNPAPVADFFFSSRKHDSEDLHSSSEFNLDNVHDVYDSGPNDNLTDEERQEAMLEPSAHTSFRELNENFLNHSAFTLLEEDQVLQTSQPSSVSKPKGADVDSSIMSAFGNTIQELHKYNLTKQGDRTKIDESKMNASRAPHVFYSNRNSDDQDKPTSNDQDPNVIFAAKKPETGTPKSSKLNDSKLSNMSTHSAHLY